MNNFVLMQNRHSAVPGVVDTSLVGVYSTIDFAIKKIRESKDKVISSRKDFFKNCPELSNPFDNIIVWRIYSCLLNEDVDQVPFESINKNFVFEAILKEQYKEFYK